MSVSWVVTIIALEWGAHAFLTRNWHRAALLRLYRTADTFAPLPDMVAFITANLLAAGVGVYLGSKMETWVLRVAVFVAIFWFTGKPLRFVSLLGVVRYIGFSPAYILKTVPTPNAQRELATILQAETLRLMEELKLDGDIRQRMNAMTILGKWLEADEPVAFLKHVAKNGIALSNATFEGELAEFRILHLFER